MKVLMQCGIIFGICVLGDSISILTHLPIPGNVFGMAILFILLCTGVLKKVHVKSVSKFLLGNMAFFFIPSGVAIIAFYKEIEKAIVPFLLIILFTTIIVMGVTGQTAQILKKLFTRSKKEECSGEIKTESTAEDVAGI